MQSRQSTVLRHLLWLGLLFGTGCEESTYSVLVQPEVSRISTVGDWAGSTETGASTNPDAIEIGRIIVSDTTASLEIAEPTVLGPFTAGSGPNSPYFENCFPLRVGHGADDAYEQGLEQFDLSGPNLAGFERLVPLDDRFYVSGFLHQGYAFPSGAELDLFATVLDPDANPFPQVAVDVDELTVTIDCRVGALDSFTLLSMALSGPGEVRLESPDRSSPLRCTNAVAPCAVGAVTPVGTPEYTVTVPESSRDTFLGFRDPDGAAGSCPLATASVQFRYTTGPGRCVAVFDGWSVAVAIDPDDAGVEIVPVSSEARLAPSDPSLVQVRSNAAASVEVSLQNNGYLPVVVTSVDGDCRRGQDPGAIVLLRPGSGAGSCSAEVDLDPGGSETPQLALSGATAPSFTLTPGPTGEPAVCAIDDEQRVSCSAGPAVLALPLTYAEPTDVTVEIAPTDGRPELRGDCVGTTENPGRATFRVEERTTCTPLVFHILDVITDVEVELTPGPSGGPTTLCSPARDGIDCDGDSEADTVEYDVPTNVTIRAQEPASFTGDCAESTTTPDESVLRVDGRVGCTLTREEAMRDARIELTLAADAGDPASRIVVLDPVTLDEVDRCAYDAASGFGSRTCELTGLPRTMILVPEGDGDGVESYADFVRFEGDCDGQLSSGPDGYTLDIFDVLEPGEAPRNNRASCRAVFDCAPGAVLDSIDLEFVEGTSSLGTVSFDVASDCTLGGSRYSCASTTAIGVPENTSVDIVTTAGGGAPGIFESLLLNFVPFSTPTFQKTNPGREPALVRIEGCEHDYQLQFFLE